VNLNNIRTIFFLHLRTFVQVSLQQNPTRRDELHLVIFPWNSKELRVAFTRQTNNWDLYGMFEKEVFIRIVKKDGLEVKSQFCLKNSRQFGNRIRAGRSQPYFNDQKTNITINRLKL